MNLQVLRVQLNRCSIKMSQLVNSTNESTNQTSQLLQRPQDLCFKTIYIRNHLWQYCNKSINFDPECYQKLFTSTCPFESRHNVQINLHYFTRNSCMQHLTAVKGFMIPTPSPIQPEPWKMLYQDSNFQNGAIFVPRRV